MSKASLAAAAVNALSDVAKGAAKTAKAAAPAAERTKAFTDKAGRVYANGRKIARKAGAAEQAAPAKTLKEAATGLVPAVRSYIEDAKVARGAAPKGARSAMAVNKDKVSKIADQVKGLKPQSLNMEGAAAKQKIGDLSHPELKALHQSMFGYKPVRGLDSKEHLQRKFTDTVDSNMRAPRAPYSGSGYGSSSSYGSGSSRSSSPGIGSSIAEAMFWPAVWFTVFG